MMDMDIGMDLGMDMGMHKDIIPALHKIGKNAESRVLPFW